MASLCYKYSFKTYYFESIGFDFLNRFQMEFISEIIYFSENEELLMC